ncbi:MAG: hypothetical protein WBX25_31635 [Rhodomicrobium sp.]
MTDQTPATKADIEKIEGKLDDILCAMDRVLEALKPLRRESEAEAAEWNKAFPPAGKLDESGDGGGI